MKANHEPGAEVVYQIGQEVTCCGKPLTFVVGRDGLPLVEVRGCLTCGKLTTFASLPSWGAAQERTVESLRGQILKREKSTLQLVARAAAAARPADEPRIRWAEDEALSLELSGAFAAQAMVESELAKLPSDEARAEWLSGFNTTPRRRWLNRIVFWIALALPVPAFFVLSSFVSWPWALALCVPVGWGTALLLTWLAPRRWF